MWGNEKKRGKLMNRHKTYEEVKLIQLIKESKRLLQKAERQGKIKFYREALQEWGYDVYFWDTVKKRQKEGRKGYRVCFAYKINPTPGLCFEVVFCHPEDNFDRLEAWRKLYENLSRGVPGYVTSITGTKKTAICDKLRKSVVHKKFVNRPSLFKRHCKTWLKDV